MKFGFLMICLFVLGTALLAKGPTKSETIGADQLTLGEAVATALQNNPTIQTAYAKWESATQKVPQAAAWEDPKLSVNSLLSRFVNMSRNGFTDQMVTVEQMIPLSGKNRSRERLASAEALATFEDARRQELDVLAKTKASYFRLENLYLLLDLNRYDEVAMSETLNSSRAKFEGSLQSQTDFLTADLERQKIIEARRDIEGRLADEQTALKVLMNQDPFSPLGRPISPGSLDHDLAEESLRRLVLENRPEVRKVHAMMIAALAKVELAKREWIPDPLVSLQAQHYNGGSQEVSEINGGVSISLPWFNEKKYRAGEREAEGDLIAAERMFKGAQTEALGLLRNQLQKIDTLHHHIKLYRDRLLPSARQAVSSNRSDYETGKTGLAQVLTAETGLRQLETMYHQDVTDYQIAITELEAVVGADMNVATQPSKITTRK